MKRSSPDLDMINEYSDAVGARSDPQVESKPVEHIEQKHAEYESVAFIPFSDFEKVDMRVGKIIEVSDVPGARKPLWKLRVDLGDVGVRTLVAGIRAFYSADELLNSQIIVVVNLKPRNLAGILSEGMLLAAEDDSGNVSLVRPDVNVRPGCRIR